jgi:O-antigen ligase/polysaccharide polymerase Wzy-like membrane protein
LSLSSDRRIAGHWWIIPLIGLGYSGYFKGSPLLSWLPIDFTVTSAVIVAIGIGIQVVSGNRHDGAALAKMVMAFAVLVPAAALSVDPLKTTTLFTITLACGLAPCFLVIGSRARVWWAIGTVAAALIACVATLAFPDAGAQEVYGRLALEGSNTILTGRVIGAGTVVTATLALTKTRWRVPLITASVFGGAMIVAVGSRGPLTGVAIAIAAVLIFARLLVGRRSVAVGISIVGVVVAAWLVARSPTGGAARIAAFLNGNADEGRIGLADEASAAIAHNPLGLGWGGFAHLGLTSGAFKLSYPHNMVIEIAVEGGWLACLAFIVLAALSMRGFVQGSTSPIGVALFGLGAYWFIVAQTSSDINGNRVTWIALSIGLTMRKTDDPTVRIPRGRWPAGRFGGSQPIQRTISAST